MGRNMPKSVAGVMREFKGGQLHSGSSQGPKVTNPKQAIAIALSEQRGMKAAQASHPAAARLGKWLHPKKS